MNKFTFSYPTRVYFGEGSAAQARKHHVDFIPAVGGGSVIDCCKVVSVQASCPKIFGIWSTAKGNFPQPGFQRAWL